LNSRAKDASQAQIGNELHVDQNPQTIEANERAQQQQEGSVVSKLAISVEKRRKLAICYKLLFTESNDNESFYNLGSDQHSKNDFQRRKIAESRVMPSMGEMGKWFSSCGFY